MKRADEELELERLLASEGLPLGASLSALRERGPDATELASLASRLALQGIDVTAQPPASTPKLWKKWVLGGAGGASAVLVWLALRAPQPALPERPDDRARAPVVASASPTAPPASPAPEAVSPRMLGQPRGGASTPEANAPAQDGNSAEAAPPSPATPAAPGAAAPARGAVERGDQGSPEPAAKARAATPHTTTGAAATDTGSPDSSGLSPGAASAPTEIELLREARLALRQSPSRALDLTDQHARLYPRGKLTQERELIAITALVALGRRTAALSRAASFEQAFPTSPYRKQVGDLLQ